MSENPVTVGGRQAEEQTELPTGWRARLAGNQRAVVVGAVAAVAVLGGGAYVALSGGSSSSSDDAAASAPVRPAASSAPSTSLPSVLPVFDGSAGVNPFKALIVPAVASATAAPSSPAPVATSTGQPAGPTSLPTVFPSFPALPPLPPLPAPTAIPTVAPSGPATASPTTVKLISVKDDNSQAAVYVSGHSVKYLLQAGDRFASDLQLVTMTNGRCASFLRAAAPFTICEGQTKAF